jgi:hypothetical protein
MMRLLVHIEINGFGPALLAASAAYFFDTANLMPILFKSPFIFDFKK